ncbi:hypothetical protein [Megalodesulfovibrio gigas]|uniref:hypothetical protein n=1 Tax=Megalodesulfovibrio gigas TaxID=879 RepID=UPI000AE04CAD|nr:hypothetical protein [Megalodesulfovibrio gigas]
MYVTVALIFLALSLLAHWRMGLATHPRPWEAELGPGMVPVVAAPPGEPRC